MKSAAFPAQGLAECTNLHHASGDLPLFLKKKMTLHSREDTADRYSAILLNL